MLITQPMALAREQRRRAAELRQTFDPSWFKRHCTVTDSMCCWSDMSWETRQICSRINGFTSMFCHSCRLGSCHMKEAQRREAQSTVAKTMETAPYIVLFSAVAHPCRQCATERDGKGTCVASTIRGKAWDRERSFGRLRRSRSSLRAGSVGLWNAAVTCHALP